MVNQRLVLNRVSVDLYSSAFVGRVLPRTGGLPVAPTVKNVLIFCLLLTGCQPKNKQQSTEQQPGVTINGQAYPDSVVVDSAGNQVRVKPGAGRANVSGSGNTVDIK